MKKSAVSSGFFENVYLSSKRLGEGGTQTFAVNIIHYTGVKIKSLALEKD